MTRPEPQPRRRLARYSLEMAIGFVLAGLIALALIASVSSVPFIYQGF
jgi:hypothetical protein